jgi:hypothetical protein
MAAPPVFTRYRAFAVEFQTAAQPLSRAAAEALWADVRTAAADFGAADTDGDVEGDSGADGGMRVERGACSHLRLVLRKKSSFGVSKPLPPYLPVAHRMGGAPSASWVPEVTGLVQLV